MNRHTKTMTRRENAALGIQAGRIVLLDVPDIDHPKLTVVVATEPRLIGFFINSHVHEMFAHDPRLVASHVRVRAADHPRCLRYDSYVNCNQIIDAVSRQQAITQLTADPSRAMGALNADEVTAMLGAVATTPSLSRGQKRMISECLRPTGDLPADRERR